MMPCVDPPYNEGDAVKSYQQQLADCQKRADKLTDLLCKACKHLGDAGLFHGPAELQEWWLGHKAWDEKRARNEVVRMKNKGV